MITRPPPTPPRRRARPVLRSLFARSVLQGRRTAAANTPAPACPIEDGPESAPGPRLTVASYNVHKCVGTDGRFMPERIAEVVGELGADVVALQEADRRFGRRSGLLDPQVLERKTGLVPLPASDLPDGLGWHGNALLVRPDMLPARLRRLSLPGAEPRGAVIAELALPGGSLRVVAAHLGLLRRCRARQAAAILEAIAEGDAMPTLLLGDLNEWRPRAAPLRALEPVFGTAPLGPASFPARLPVLALDRILGWPSGIVGNVEVHESALARIASDHLPLKASIALSAGLSSAPAAAAVEVSDLAAAA